MAGRRTQRRCPKCRKYMYIGGSIRAGPRGGKRKVYYCKNCGYRTI